jgi:hypothetical protein
MAKEIIIVYTCDEHYSHASKRYFGVYTTKNKAIKRIKEYDLNLTRLDINHLNAFGRTQTANNGYILDSAILNE